mmetsp:Transcript_48315/g.89974  ORF Transcript_48315/g.89974 Transcript_48315/m.89974 type:complete len:302 (+) Transcript_48315:63-968(+)
MGGISARDGVRLCCLANLFQSLLLHASCVHDCIVPQTLRLSTHFLLPLQSPLHLLQLHLQRQLRALQLLHFAPVQPQLRSCVVRCCCGGAGELVVGVVHHHPVRGRRVRHLPHRLQRGSLLRLSSPQVLSLVVGVPWCIWQQGSKLGADLRHRSLRNHRRSLRGGKCRRLLHVAQRLLRHLLSLPLRAFAHTQLLHSHGGLLQGNLQTLNLPLHGSARLAGLLLGHCEGVDVLRRRALLARVALGDLGGVVVGRVQLSLKLGASLSRRGQLRRQLINGACTPVRALRLQVGALSLDTQLGG